MRLPILTRVLLGISLSISTLAACTTLKEVPTTHIVMVNGRGNPVDPTGNIFCPEEPKLCAEEGGTGTHLMAGKDYPDIARKAYSGYLDLLLKDLVEHAPKRDGKRQLLVFIHGGLNTQTGTVKRAVELMKAIPQDKYYPIFINWQSSLFSSYADHLVHVRQGISWDGWELLTTPVLVPAYFAADVTRAVVRAPIVWVFLAWNWVKSVGSTETISEANAIAKELEEQYEKNRSADMVKVAHDPLDQRGSWDAGLAHTTAALTIPTKLIGSMFIDAFGKSAWDIMLRRTHLLYHTEREFFESQKVAIDQGLQEQGKKETPTSRIKADGGLSVFLRRLQETIDDRVNGGRDAWEITLVGHSMGTIVLNQMVREFGLKTVPGLEGKPPTTGVALPFNQIVYMAGAATVRDYQDSVFPYLRENQNAKVYHLTLHPKAEVRERFDPGVPYLDLPPRGSLLVWVDDFLSAPETPLDRTVGRFENLLHAVHNTPDDLRGRVHIKAFGTGREVRAPQKHADFTGHVKFWKSECWWSPGTDYPFDCYCD